MAFVVKVEGAETFVDVHDEIIAKASEIATIFITFIFFIFIPHFQY